MEWARNTRQYPMTFNCDLELESVYLSHGFSTLPHQDQNLTSLMKILPGVKEIWR